MTTFAVTDPAHTIAAINYALSNLTTGNVSGNVTLPGNVLVANTATGVISQYGNTAQVFGYLYQWVNLRYSNNSTGGSGSFSTVPTNANYYGVFNSVSSAPSNNPTDYQWYQVAGGFGTSRILYYSAIGGRQVQWAAANSAPSSDYVPSVANVAINLDIVTTAAGTPGQRGPIAMAYVVTTADPTTATSSQLTAWFSASRDATTPPIGTGLSPPVVGDTAQFVYINGTTNPSVCYTYNGSIWSPVNAQVISGNVLVNGTVAANAIIAGSITSTQIAADSIVGSRIAANTITSTNIQTGTITANNIAGNTITGNNIAAGTITTNNFTANTIQGNIIAAGTITAEQLAANAITANTVVSTGAVLGSDASLGFWLDGTTGNARFGNNLSIGSSVTIGTVISGGSLTGNTVGATQIVNGSITTDKFTANTINGNIISAGTITANQLSANALTANTVVSTGATLGSNTSPGFWLQGNTGNARFGNSVSIGNLLTVGTNAFIGANLTVGANSSIGGNLIIGTNANIGANLTVGANASIGNLLTVGTNAFIGANLTVGANSSIGGNLIIGTNANIGANLTVGANASIGGNLIIGSNANISVNLKIGNTATIGNNLTVGANANIGGNLFVSGLITTGNLNANTVSTTTILPSNVTIATSNNTTAGPIYNSPSNNVWYSTNITTTITPPTPPTSMYVLVWDSAEFQIFYTGQAISITTEILRSSTGGNVSLDSTTSDFISSGTGSHTLASTYFTNGWIDATLPSGSPVMTYVRRIKFGTVSGYPAPVVSLLGFQNVSITAQLAKR